jgi:hypothetical protein
MSQSEYRTRIHDHAEVLRRNLLSSGDHARKYLTLANAGGAVALLAFMGNNPAVRNALVSRISLLLFIVGVILVGVLSAFDFHSRQHAFWTWKRLSDQFFRGEIEYQDMLNAFNVGIAAHEQRPVTCAYISFGCFILGSLLSIYGFFVAHGY